MNTDNTVDQQTKPETPTVSRQKTIEQKRAGAAWQFVTGVKSDKCEYGAWAKKFPMLVLTNGLGQTLAFLKAKDKSHHRELYDHVSLWVTAQIYNIPDGDKQLLERLMGAVSGCDSNSDIYRRATTEALAFANWLKRFAEAYLNIKDAAD